MIHTGTIMEIKNNRAYVFTQSCDMVQIRSKEEYLLGQQVHFSDRDMLRQPGVLRLSDFRMLSVAAVALILVASIIMAAVFLPRSFGGFDTTCAAVISVDINPSIELSVNKDMRIIDVVYTNEDGAALSGELQLKSKTVSEALSQIMALAGQKGFLQEGRIVLVSAAPNSDQPSKSTEQQLRQILTAFEQESGPDVFTVYIDDADVISQAQQIDLSIGKLVLYKYAVDKGYDISVQEFRDTSVNDILVKLNVNAEDIMEEGAGTETATPSPDPTPSVMPSVEPSLAPFPSPSPSPSPSAPPAPEPTPEIIPSASFTPKMTASVSGAKLKFSWAPLSGSSVTYNGTAYEGFKYYKVVASQNDPTPVYPDNGYLHVASDIGSSSWSVDPSGDSYNQSPVLEAGVKYYFAITYVFDNGKFVSNTVKLTIPDYSEKPSPSSSVMPTPQLSVSVGGETLYFNWTSLPDSTVTYGGTTYKNFKYAKVVASPSDSTPIYPDNGYLYYASDPGASSWSVTPVRDNYNHSPELEPGKTYYFAITYVFDNGKFVSNTVTATVPNYTEPTVPTMSDTALSVSYSGGMLYFSWTALPDYTVNYGGTRYENFSYYKVVASETNPHPVYPDDGYLTYQTGLQENSWSTDPASAGLESGKTYYFAITYVFGNGKFVTNTVTFTIP